jgi:hypothetical protein
MKKKALEETPVKRSYQPVTWQQRLREEYSQDKMTNQQIEILAKERQLQYEMVGIAEDESEVKIDELKKQFNLADMKLPGIRKRAQFLNLT